MIIPKNSDSKFKTAVNPIQEPKSSENNTEMNTI